MLCLWPSLGDGTYNVYCTNSEPGIPITKWLHILKAGKNTRSKRSSRLDITLKKAEADFLAVLNILS